MRVLFITKHKWPHIGGVERHIDAISHKLNALGYKTTIISAEDIKQPKIKIFGLLYIWYWLLKNIDLIKSSDIIHIHDVFIWFLPFKFLFPFKKVYITFHGWEGVYPIPFWNIFNKKLANLLCNGSIVVGKYIEKWYGIKTNYTIHGAIQPLAVSHLPLAKTKNTLVYLGRTDRDTGYFEFKKWIKRHPRLKVKYITNDPNPEKYLKTGEFCVPSGYLSYLEAKNYGCKIITFSTNPLKVDYWNEIQELKIIPSWSEVAGIYRKLWEIN